MTRAWETLRSGRYNVRLTVDSTQYGVFETDATVDVDADITRVVTGFPDDRAEVLTFGDDVLIEAEEVLQGIPGMKPGAKWIHVDGKRMEGYSPRAAEFTALADRVGDGVTQAYWAAPREIRGRLDTAKVRFGALTYTAGDLAGLMVGPDESVLVPFTATLDEQNRLATMTWDLSRTGRPIAVVVSFAFSRYGTVRTPKPPALRTIVEAPEASYREMKNGIAELERSVAEERRR